MSVYGWKSALIHCPPCFCLFIVKEDGEGEGYPSVYHRPWRTYHVALKKKKRKKGNGLHLKDIKTKNI